MPLHAQNVEDTSGFAPHVVDLPLGAARSGHVHVLLTTEGPYPHERGGVSTWCHVLMQHMAEVDFTLWAAATTPEA
ncbi:MAG TPA: DUF3492 domain-containing protein, partial [Acidimicrobiales bacterium]|nr:DUF3492 domain-containing protein [Acidimicrobiales bacterium]